ncbi:uncharacterized protein LOC126674096 [Mercurialis annua]|uniref:uncharacterized protein LOC126674096 n=1 Tax=Mercurialis annua TaxID=3986 RepID=UPI00215F0E91|nr:uncharacterized protein LOC126674096 [Mercurialis annua]
MALVNRTSGYMGPVFISRTDSLLSGFSYTDHNSSLMMEKRQLFLRSYQFRRKQSLTERMKKSLVKVKKILWFKLRSARKFRRLVWSRLRFAFYCRRSRKFLRILSPNHHKYSSPSSCFW